MDTAGSRFWNATDACCNFYGSTVDHSTQLRTLIESTQAAFSVDPRRIWIVGHSNGGFMSYRLACDHADLIAAVTSLAGMTFFNPADCTPSGPLHTLQIHGTNDGVIRFDGGQLGGTPYPGAIATAETWATYNGCTLVLDTSAPNINIDAGIPGDETTVTRYGSDCNLGGSAELWTVFGATHFPNLSSEFARLVVEWLYAHPKPGAGWAYSNGGYVLLAAILETVCEETLATILKEQLTDPASLESTELEVTPPWDSLSYDGHRVIAGLASGYNGSPGELQVASSKMYAIPGAGGIVTNAGDLTDFTHALFEGELLAPDTLKAMTTVAPGQSVPYALGWIVKKREGRTVYVHDGGNNGFVTSLEYYPDEKLTIVILSNLGYVAMGAVRDEVARLTFAAID